MMTAIKAAVSATARTAALVRIAHIAGFQIASPRESGSPVMDRQMILSHLAQCEEHVALGEKHIAHQRQIILDLERQNLDPAEARSLLIRFEEMQVEHVAHRDRLQKELAEK